MTKWSVSIDYGRIPRRYRNLSYSGWKLFPLLHSFCEDIHQISSVQPCNLKGYCRKGDRYEITYRTPDILDCIDNIGWIDFSFEVKITPESTRQSSIVC